jgi:hypothetical protein
MTKYDYIASISMLRTSAPVRWAPSALLSAQQLNLAWRWFTQMHRLANLFLIKQVCKLAE